MKLKTVTLRNFRRFEEATIDFDDEETICVGPNNSGKTSVAAAFRIFLGEQAFRIHDFSVSQISKIDTFTSKKTSLPTIEMDLWFSIDPDNIEYGRSAELIFDISHEYDSVGMRLKYGVKNLDKLLSDYKSSSDNNKKSLSHYLSLSGNLNAYYEISYWRLDKTDDDGNARLISPKEGKKILSSLLHVDFVDAQRNIDDRELSKNNSLSKVFLSFYKQNLEQISPNQQVNLAIDQHNEKLTEHFSTSFKDIMNIFNKLGFPPINDRSIKIASSLSAESVLQDNTTIFYVDDDLGHELPEAYTGLGYKNLVYITIQIIHLYLQWIKTEVNRPLCEIIFIEEPEVHLHAQIQQTFILNIWDAIKEAAKSNKSNPMPQLVITTHSSHILNTVKFEKARYFKRCHRSGDNIDQVKKLHASKIKNLANFSDDAKGNFVKKYLKLTHCDLFFADAVIFVEGPTEKILLPKMIEKCAKGLNSKYITILEVGGAYAHRFIKLLEFIGLPYLIITDLDSVDPKNKSTKCEASTPESVTSNPSINYFFKKKRTKRRLICELISIPSEEHCINNLGYVSFQKPIDSMLGRTFEEAFIHQNIDQFRKELLSFGSSKDEDNFRDSSTIYEYVNSLSSEKTEFAISILISKFNWCTPSYIKEGLEWLLQKLS